MATDFRKAYEQRFGVQKGWLKLYDAKGNLIYCEDSSDWWMKCEYDDKGNVIYRESSNGGITLDNRNNLEGKIATIDGKEYQLTRIK
jgi:hypothetical protein